MIEVRVNSYGGGRNLSLRWTDPNTGRRRARSAGTSNRKEAERAVALLEKELREGGYADPIKTTWQDFTWKYSDEVLPGLAKKTRAQLGIVFNTVERILKPKRLADVTAPRLSIGSSISVGSSRDSEVVPSG